MAGGRPSTYTVELAARVCELVATHTCGIRKLCAMYDELPDVSTINLWRFKHKEFSTQYLSAKQAQMDLVMEDLNDDMNDELRFYHDDKGNERIDAPSVTIAVAKANNKKWFASKLAPKLYGVKPDEDTTTANTLIEKLIDKL